MLFNTENGILSEDEIRIGRFEFERINKNEVKGKIAKQMYKDWEDGIGGDDLYNLPRRRTDWDEQCWTYSTLMMNELGGKGLVIPSWTENKYAIDFELDFLGYDAQVHIIVDSKGESMKKYIVL